MRLSTRNDVAVAKCGKNQSDKDGTGAFCPKKTRAKEKQRTKKGTARKYHVSPGVSAPNYITSCASLDNEESLYNDKNEKQNTGLSASLGKYDCNG